MMHNNEIVAARQLLKKLQKKEAIISEMALKNIENISYHEIFPTISPKNWGKILKEVIFYFGLLEGLPPYTSQLEYNINRLDHKIRAIPFNCANINLSKARLDYTDILLDQQKLLDSLYSSRGFIVDFMQKLMNAVSSGSRISSLANTLASTLTDEPRLEASFSNWFKTDIFKSDVDFEELMSESYTAYIQFNHLRTTAYST